MTESHGWTDEQVEKLTEVLTKEVQGETGWFTTNNISNGSWVSDVFPRGGIHITGIVPPESGWPIAMHCPICKTTVFQHNPYAIKPEDGDYWLMRDTCASEEHGFQHNMQLAMKCNPVYVEKEQPLWMKRNFL